MGRVVNLNTSGKERTHLSRSVVLALRELAQQDKISDQTRDLASYIALALDAIMKTVDQSVAAWEKRGYWLKADRFRMDWIWSQTYGDRMRQAVLNNDWQTVAVTAAQVSEKLQTIKLPQRHKLGTPWIGAWKRLCELEALRPSSTSPSSAQR